MHLVTLQPASNVAVMTWSPAPNIFWPAVPPTVTTWVRISESFLSMLSASLPCPTLPHAFLPHPAPSHTSGFPFGFFSILSTQLVLFAIQPLETQQHLGSFHIPACVKWCKLQLECSMLLQRQSFKTEKFRT